MGTRKITQDPKSTESDQNSAIEARIDLCMKRYQPYLRYDFSMHHLSLITSIPLQQISDYFSHAGNQTFNQYVDGWRIRYAINLMMSGKVQGLELKAIALLAGFSSPRQFIKAFLNNGFDMPKYFHSEGI